MLKKNKHASSEIDWIISLLIFILYISLVVNIFAITIKKNKINYNNDAENIINQLKTQYLWTINVTPIIIHSNIDSTEYWPIEITDFNINSNTHYLKDSYTHKDDENNTLYIITQIKKQNIKEIISSQEETNEDLPENDFICSEKYCIKTQEKIFYTFTNNLLTQISYKTQNLITQINYFFEDEEIIIENTSTKNTHIFSEKSTTTLHSNIKNKIFSKNPRLFLSFENLKNTTIIKEKKLTTELIGINFTSFSTNSFKNINFNYNILETEKCFETTTDYLSLNTNQSKTIITFDTDYQINICNTNTSTRILITILLNDTTKTIRFNVKESSYDENKDRIKIEYQTGKQYQLTGITPNELQNIENTDIEQIKQQINFKKDISIYGQINGEEIFKINEIDDYNKDSYTKRTIIPIYYYNKTTSFLITTIKIYD